MKGAGLESRPTHKRSGHTNKIIVNGDSHDAASQPRLSGCVPSPAAEDGGGAVVTIRKLISRELFSKYSSLCDHAVTVPEGTE